MIERVARWMLAGIAVLGLVMGGAGLFVVKVLGRPEAAAEARISATDAMWGGLALVLVALVLSGVAAGLGAGRPSTSPRTVGGRVVDRHDR